LQIEKLNFERQEGEAPSEPGLPGPSTDNA
jgi:hypothetical protein